MEAPVSFCATISGKVQGVGFRYAVYREAKKLGVRGFIKNKKDGSVYLEAEGSSEVIKDFFQWCRSVQKNAQIENIEFASCAIRGFSGFEIQ
ncbi:MAG: acylphosphatase [Patescibacteria group bacterium]|nr:acylphosphatase [Patescibacteria group bacterium]